MPGTTYTDALSALTTLAGELVTAPNAPRRKFSLDEIGKLLQALGNPHHHFRSILIAGTNGKGSTASTLASILTAADHKTGLFTSPHLERVNERIRIGHALIPDDAFAAHYFKVHDTAQQLVLSGTLPQMPSYFEVMTALAFDYFAEQKIEIAVLEVGMGGRLDATNIVDPLVSVITDISLDHTEWLGKTITEITREKAGILRPHGTLITLPQHPQANQAIGEAAVPLEVRAINAADYMPALGTPNTAAYELTVLNQQITIASPLKGAHQQRNLALAIATAVELGTHHNIAIDAAQIATGIALTRWPGRLEQIADNNATFLLDVAHNPAGAWALRTGLDDSSPKTLIFSCLRDKSINELAQILFPLFDRVFFAPINSPRATSMESLLAAASLTGTPATVTNSVTEAINLARLSGGAVISGSVYLVGEARAILTGAHA